MESGAISVLRRFRWVILLYRRKVGCPASPGDVSEFLTFAWFFSSVLGC